MKKFFLLTVFLFTFACAFSQDDPQPVTDSKEIAQSETQTSEQDETEYLPFFGKDIFSFNIFFLLDFSSINDEAGFGLSYEHQFLPFLSLKGNFDTHFYFFSSNVRVNTIGLSVAALYYPFCKGMKNLYLGVGESTEFFTYKGVYIPENEKNKSDIMISIFPIIGWKQVISDYLMIDIYNGWRFPIYTKDSYNYVSELGTKGLDFGIKFKFNFGKLKSIYKAYKAKKTLKKAERKNSDESQITSNS